MAQVKIRVQSKKALTFGILASVFLAMAPALIIVDEADARPATKVTICHRTNATTNPYRRITVSKNAADGQGNNDHTSHNESYNDGTTIHKVFNKDITYPNNQKDWGDIIPPFTSGNSLTSGYNWDEPRAQSIFYGTDGYFGVCKSLNAKQYIEAQVSSRPAGETEADAKARALHELDDMGANEDAALKSELGGSFTLADPADLERELNELTVPPAGPTPPAAISQSIAGVVWIDLDRDGVEDEGEPRAKGVSVTLDDPAVTTGIAARRITAQSTTYITTDETGAFLFTSVVEGEWLVSATPPAELSVTYDSEGAASDGQALVLVPAGSAGFGWVGLVGDGSIQAEVRDPLNQPADTEVVICWAGQDNIRDNSDDVCFTLTPTGGEVNQDGLPAGNYSLDSVDGEASEGEFTLQSLTPYTTPLGSDTQALLPQVITFEQPNDQLLGDGTLTIAPTADSSLAVTLTSSTPSVCTISGGVITFVAAGTCTIEASQAGNGTYSPATSVTRSFLISDPDSPTPEEPVDEEVVDGETGAPENRNEVLADTGGTDSTLLQLAAGLTMIAAGATMLKTRRRRH
ncbi:SdrD B-like domain-containing protein [Rhodoluna sp.]|uniref:SdrD B-like domain-containing protein n=1 Tax=Rhodoluna sp. TaxID=1969481 RepID=UPI002600D42B|nr:SdrD B-like domain-containing protein [Rhodoluna sp.]